MVTFRTPLLLLVCLIICILLWIVAESIPQGQTSPRWLRIACSLTPHSERWLQHRCLSLRMGLPRNCLLKPYTAADVKTCLALQRPRICGGLEARHAFTSISQMLEQPQLRNSSEEHEGITYEVATFTSGEAQISYQDDPQLGATGKYHAEALSLPSSRNTDEQNPATRPLFAMMPFNQTRLLYHDPKLLQTVTFYSTETGVHFPPNSAQMVLNSFCNNRMDTAMGQTQAYCCASYTAPNFLQRILLFAASFSVLTGLCLSVRDKHPVGGTDHKYGPTAETRHFLAASAKVSAVLILCFVTDRTPLLGKNAKAVNSSDFFWLTSVALIAGMASWVRTEDSSDSFPHSNDSDEAGPRFLSRQHTEEWKGWMQIVILLYHYFGMSKVLWVYQFVRLLVSAYLFMTGFGHATYFITTKDFSIQRSASALLRTNLLNVILAFVLETQYDLYYFPVLTSLWFLIVRATLPSMGDSGSGTGYRLQRIVMSAIFVRIILQWSNAVEHLLDSLAGLPFGLPNLDSRELLFRFCLDVYIPYVGMAIGVILARLRASDSLPQNSPVWGPAFGRGLTSKLAILTAVLVISAYALICTTFSDKLHYNRWHPLISPFPVLSFIILRNATGTLRSRHSQFFAWFGRCSLETFVLQYHLWLGADSRGQLRLGISKNLVQSPQGRHLLEVLETVLIFVVFVSVSSMASRALTSIAKYLANLRIGLLFVLAGIWMVNLAWSRFPALRHHDSLHWRDQAEL